VQEKEQDRLHALHQLSTATARVQQLQQQVRVEHGALGYRVCVRPLCVWCIGAPTICIVPALLVRRIAPSRRVTHGVSRLPVQCTQHAELANRLRRLHIRSRLQSKLSTTAESVGDSDDFSGGDENAVAGDHSFMSVDASDDWSPTQQRRRAGVAAAMMPASGSALVHGGSSHAVATVASGKQRRSPTTTATTTTTTMMMMMPAAATAVLPTGTSARGSTSSGVSPRARRAAKAKQQQQLLQQQQQQQQWGTLMVM
jgi:hypothetical protein